MTSRSRFAAPTFGTLLFALLLFAAWVRPFADLDFAWQVRTGEQIVRTGSLRVEEVSCCQCGLARRLQTAPKTNGPEVPLFARRGQAGGIGARQGASRRPSR